MLNLSIKIFWHFLKNNKLLVGFLCLIQIISIFASLFVFSYFASYTNANKKYDNSKTYTVSFNGAFIDDNMMLKEIEHFNNKCDLELNAVSIKANIDDTRIMFDYLYYPNHIKHGRYFNQDEFVTNKHVIISGDEGVIEEDKISICNDKYTVIGTYSVGGYNILPISSINDVKHNNESVSIVLDKYPDDDENNKIISQLTECFENAEIIYPERIKNIDSLWNDSTTIIYIGIFLLSMINVAFVYLYILEKNNKIIYIYRLNDATKTTCIFLLANVIFIIALISFVCGCIFSRCVLPSIIEYVQYEDFTYSLGIYDYISMIIVYFIVIIITSAPVISKYVKNISISEKRLG